jgi:hypothetical protein
MRYSLSSYESKLRNLGLRKKMKTKDWQPIYQHYISSGSRHTAVYFQGIRIPWAKAWKEIRRSGARECDYSKTPTRCLFELFQIDKPY